MRKINWMGRMEMSLVEDSGCSWRREWKCWRSCWRLRASKLTNSKGLFIQLMTLSTKYATKPKT